MTDNMRNIKIGDRVWWFDSYDVLRWGDVYGIKENYAMIHENGKGRHIGARLDDCYFDRETCIEAKQAKTDAEMKNYEAQITDPAALVQFMYHKLIGLCEFIDEASVRAIRHRAKDLLDVDFD